MSTYKIASDSHSATIITNTADEAANKFDRSVKTMAALIATVENLGGYISVSEDGVEIARVSAN